jgi:hypothetical protein
MRINFIIIIKMKNILLIIKIYLLTKKINKIIDLFLSYFKKNMLIFISK